MVKYVKYDKKTRKLLEHTLDEGKGELVPTQNYIDFSEVHQVGSEIILGKAYKKRDFFTGTEVKDKLNSLNGLHKDATKLANTEYSADYVQIGKLHQKNEDGYSILTHSATAEMIHYETIATMYIKK